MKKIVISTAVICLAATTVFAAPASAPAPRPQVGGAPTTSAPVLGRPSVAPNAPAVGVGTQKQGQNVLGKDAKTGSQNQGNAIVNASADVKLGENCPMGSPIALLSSTQLSQLESFKRMGLYRGDGCMKEIAGADIVAAGTAIEIMAAQAARMRQLGVTSESQLSATQVADVQAASAGLVKDGLSAIQYLSSNCKIGAN